MQVPRVTHVRVSRDSRARAFVRTPISFSFIITLFSVCFYFRPLNKNSKVRCLKLFFRLLFSVKAGLLVCVLVHCRGGRVSTEGAEGQGRAWGRPLGSALLGQTPPGAHAARSPRCPGDGCPPVTPGFESLGPSCAFPRLLSQVVLAGPPLGLPASPPCPSVSCSPHASHRQPARSSLHLPTTGECGPAAARPVRGAGAWGPAAQPPRAPGAVSATCVLRGHGGRGSAEQPWLVPRAGVTGGSHVVNSRPVLARGA